MLMIQVKTVSYTHLIHFEDLTEIDELSEATADGRGFAVSGGVAQAVVNCIHEKYPDKEVKVHAEESLRNCRKMLQDAKKGVYDGYLLEGMACLLYTSSIKSLFSSIYWYGNKEIFKNS